MLSSLRPVVVIGRRSVLVGRWLGSQLALQRHPHAMSHSTAAAPVHAGFALQRCGNQWVARFNGVWSSCRSIHSVQPNKTARVLAHPGPLACEGDDSAGRTDLGGCASPPLRWATVRCSVAGCKEETCHSTTMRCADDKRTFTYVKVVQRFRLRGATPLRVRCQSASPSSVGGGAGAACACGARASPSRSSNRARARSGSRR